ncbi:MAG: hypothetical protein U0805_22275 [Pirellulales bacterium]
MRGVFSSLVACSLLIHAAIGCCWHHPHEEGCDESAAVAVDCDPHHADHVAGHSQHSEGPCNGHSNCQGTCHYLPGQKTQLDQLSPLAGVELAAVLPAACDCEIAAVYSTEQSHDMPAQLPVRLHLYHQILLI